MQAKLHRWAAADPGRRFDDVFNLVHDPATLLVAWDRVAGNRGANTAGSDAWTVTRIEAEVGVARTYFPESLLERRPSSITAATRGAHVHMYPSIRSRAGRHCARRSRGERA